MGGGGGVTSVVTTGRLGLVDPHPAIVARREVPSLGMVGGGVR